MVGGISVWQLLILLLIVVLVFGTKRLRNIGSDLGSAIKGFRKGMEEEPDSGAAGQIGADSMPSASLNEASQESQTEEQRSPGNDV